MTHLTYHRDSAGELLFAEKNGKRLELTQVLNIRNITRKLNGDGTVSCTMDLSVDSYKEFVDDNLTNDS